MSFSDPRGQLHPALARDAEPYEYSVEKWAHDRDEDRVLAEGWPFGDGPGKWSVPAPTYNSAQERDRGAYVGPAHPRSTQAIRARVKSGTSQAEKYAAQAGLYARAAGRALRPQRPTGSGPDLIIVDEISADYGTRLHQLMEALGAERRSPEEIRRHLGEWPDGT